MGGGSYGAVDTIDVQGAGLAKRLKQFFEGVVHYSLCGASGRSHCQRQQQPSERVHEWPRRPGAVFIDPGSVHGMRLCKGSADLRY
jgi:hypothetical protein